MAAASTPLPRIRIAQSQKAQSQDQRYWSRFSTQTLVPTVNNAPVTFLSFNSPLASAQLGSAAASSYIAVTTGSRLQLLSTQTLKTVRTITRTTSAFHGANIRPDGRVLLAGTENGAVQVFDVASRAILKTWEGEHRQPVWVSKWHPSELTTAMTCSDDKTVRLWDLPSEKSVWTAWGHEDYVRCGAFLSGASRLIVTGSYDQTIRIWDPRVGGGGEDGAYSGGTSKSAVMHFKLASPVESVLPLPGATTIAGAAGEKMVVIDIVAGKPLHLLQNHQKAITSLTLANQGTRVLSGALDGHVKVYDSSAWQVVAGFKYPSPVLSMTVVTSGIDRSDRHLCVGMQNGVVSMRTRLSSAQKLAKRERESELTALAEGKIEAFDRRKAKIQKLKGRNTDSLRVAALNVADIIIDGRGDRTSKPKRLSPWELALKRGQYALSLDLALETRDRIQIFTLITALIHTSALKVSIENRSSATLLPLLKFLNRNISDPHFVRITTDLALLVLDVYAENLGLSGEVDGFIRLLHDAVRRATEVAQSCWGTLGMLDLLTSDSSDSLLNTSSSFSRRAVEG